MPTISQSLSIPAALANGQVADATQVITLYNAMNAFVIPATVGGFQQALATTGTTTILTGANADFSLSAAKDKAIIAVMSFNWVGSTSAAVQFRLNAATITASTVVATATTGAGLIFGVIGGHDATFQYPVMFLVAPNDGSAVKLIAANTTLPNVDTSSLGITVGGAGATMTVAYKLVVAQG